MDQAGWITHTNEVIHDLDNVLSAITKSESAFRGYVITNNRNLLNDYYKSRILADSTFDRVKKITSNNSLQQERLKTLRAMMDEKIAWIDRDILIFDSSHDISTKFLGSGEEDINRMLNIEAQVRELENQEKFQLAVRTANVARYSGIIKIINIVSIILAILLTIYSIATFNKENKAKLMADQQAEDFRKQLEQRFQELAKLNLELIELRNIEKFAVTGRISRTIAHEVRNPLTNINLAVEHLKSEVAETEDIDMLFEMIMRNTERINQLISNLLNSTRTAELALVKASINDILDTSLEFAIDRIELKKINVVKNYDPDICPVLVNNEKIYIAFLNIIVNAIEAMEDHGTLTLSTENLDSRCVAKISDTGSGMSKGDVDKLFEPYFTTKENGHGLGLTNTQNIILSHNAKILAESTPGKGTTFIVTFDFATEDHAELLA